MFHGAKVSLISEKRIGRSPIFSCPGNPGDQVGCRDSSSQGAAWLVAGSRHSTAREPWHHI